MAQPLEVRAVTSRRQLGQFIRLPWRLYRDDPLWVPPLRAAMRRTLEPQRHPFFEHAEATLYLAWRGRRPVGRIAAIVNYLHNNYHGEATGFWGFFETEHDPAVAKALLDQAADDLRARGMTEMRGPMSPSINAECGLLVEGFDDPPAILMPYNPPTYPSLVELAGHQPLKDLYAYLIRHTEVGKERQNIQRLQRLTQAVRRRHPEITIRPLDMRHYEADARAANDLFNTVRRDNWGFVPVTDAEFGLMARQMKPIVEPKLVLLAEAKGQLVGCLMGLPDVNPLLRKCNGRLLPFGWRHLVFGRRKLRRVRLFGLAVLPSHRHGGIAPLMLGQMIANGLELGYRSGELSWVAEDNVQSVQTIEHAVRPQLYKRYRVYTFEL